MTDEHPPFPVCPYCGKMMAIDYRWEGDPKIHRWICKCGYEDETEDEE